MLIAIWKAIVQNFVAPKKTPNLFFITKVITQLIKLVWVLIKYPCLFYGQMDHKYVDCPNRFEVQIIL